MDVFQLIQELRSIDARQLAYAEAIKDEIRKHGLSITTNVTSCNRNDCYSCRLGFGHGPYFIATLNGRKVRIKQAELACFLSKFVSEDLVREFVDTQRRRHLLLKRINNMVRWREQEIRNIQWLIKYSTTPAQLATVFQNSQMHNNDSFAKLAEKGTQFLCFVLERGMDKLTRFLEGRGAQQNEK
ncbi:MAG: hypothetical protein QXF61_08305 [Nitrososphaeria archaeon]